MDRQSKDRIAIVDEDELKVFVRSSPQELETGELDQVAGGAKAVWVPWG